jgi:regulator of cell morphogenesis and NO signaling
MNQLSGRKIDNQHLRLRNQEFEYPYYADIGIHSRGVTKPDFNSLESMIEHDLRRFHKDSKTDVIIIYELSQEVFYRHNEGNPELAELAASLFLFFSDFTHYLNIEEQQLIPAVQDLFQKIETSEIQNLENKPVIRELIRKIRLEHNEALKKLSYFKTLTKDYLTPVNACKSYKLFFAKLKRFQNDLIRYIHFENNKFFPLVILLEDYMRKNNCDL